MLVTLAQMKDYLNITSSDYDAFLTEQIETVSEAIEAYCVRKFGLADYVETFYADEWIKTNDRSSERLMLLAFPVVSLTEVRKFSDDQDLVGEVLTTRPHFPTGMVDKIKFESRFQRISVTYRAGLNPVPAPVKQVVYSVVSERYNKRQAGVELNFGSDVQRISIPGSISIDFDYSLQNNDRKSAFGVILGANVNILDYYRSDRAVVHSSRLEYVTSTPVV
jgi:hypothetical protein